MFDWRSVTDDPNDLAAFKGMDAFFRSITRIEETSRREMVIDFTRGLDVLDIGAAGHIAVEDLKNWEHGHIAKVARKAVAAELSQANCAHYNARGFDFRHVDATSAVDLGDRFDRIFAGDVIEHVNDPVALLTFMKRHLKADGRILLTTPNPFAPRFRKTRCRWGTRYVVANLEHTCWISVSTMHELAHRAGLQLTALRWPLLKKPRSGLYGRLSFAVKKLILKIVPLESMFHEYAFELALRVNAR